MNFTPRIPRNQKQQSNKYGNLFRITKEKLKDRGCTLEAYTYRFTPHWFGILPGEDKLFLCRSSWDDDEQLRGGANPVELLSATDPFPIPEKMKEFATWFDVACGKRVDIGI